MHFQRNFTNVFPFHSWTGIEIDSQLIGMLKIGSPYGVRV